MTDTAQQSPVNERPDSIQLTDKEYLKIWDLDIQYHSTSCNEYDPGFSMTADLEDGFIGRFQFMARPTDRESFVDAFCDEFFHGHNDIDFPMSEANVFLDDPENKTEAFVKAIAEHFADDQALYNYYIEFPVLGEYDEDETLEDFEIREDDFYSEFSVYHYFVVEVQPIGFAAR